MELKFEREERYQVIKLKTGKPVDCVVVESDWPEYEIVWQMIEARVSGKPSEIDRLRAEVEQVNALYQDLGAEAVKLHDRISELEAALKVARDVLDFCRGEINPERAYADEYEQEIREALAKIDEVLK